MAIQAYLQVKANGSEIKGGSVDTKQHDGWCDVITFEFRAESKRDQSTGLATGRRSYQPLTILKTLDKASPLFFKAFAMNQVIEAKIELWRDKPKGGGREKYYTYELKEGRIAAVDQFAPPEASNEANKGTLERIAIVFQTVVLTWEDGGITHEDNWTQAGT